MHVLHDVVADGLGLRRDDEDGLLAVEAGGHAVRQLRRHVNGDDTEQRDLDAEERNRTHDDQEVQHKDDRADIEGVVLLGHGRDDVEAARVRVGAEDHAEADAGEHAAEDGVEHRVAADAPVDEEVRRIEENRQRHRAEDRVRGVEAAEDTVGEVEDRQVVDEVLHADGQADQVVDDQGHAADAARQEMRGDQEQVEAQADEQAAERDLEVAHGVLAP